ncbi:MAG: Zn-dependent hydrolase, partial [Acidobacteriota bacterium]
MRDVHARLRTWMESLGMRVQVDAAGNLRGVHPALQASAPQLFLGSHLDTVPCAGAFDGILGVVLAVALVDRLGGRRLPFSIEVVGFSEEEGVRFGVPFIGSRALAGSVDEALLTRRDATGATVADAIRDYGLDPLRINDARADGALAGYLEVHI